MDADAGRLHAVLRLHEHELAAGVRHPGRSGQHHRAWRTRSGTADTLLSAAQSPFLFTIKVPKDFGNEGIDLDIDVERKNRESVRVAEDRLPDRQPGDLDRGRRRFRQSPRRAAHQHPAGTARRGRQEAYGQGRSAADVDRVRRRSRQPAGTPGRQAAAAQRRRPDVRRSAGSTRRDARAARGQPHAHAEPIYRPPSSIVASSGPGLRLSWIVYRGKAASSPSIRIR